MFKLNPFSPFSAPLFSAQGIHWSYKRKLALASQLVMLLIAMIIVTNIAISLGQKQLTREWATQRYSELQTFSTLLADQVAFQNFRIRTFASSETFIHFLQSPSNTRHEQLNKHWMDLTEDIPELLSIAFYDAAGYRRLVTQNQKIMPILSQSLLTKLYLLREGEVYSSQIHQIAINGVLEPYQFQIIKVVSPQKKLVGFFVTFNSINRTLQSIKPNFGGSSSPLVLLDSKGRMFDGNKFSSAKRETNDERSMHLSTQYPELWNAINIKKFGEFYGKASTYVYLKVDFGESSSSTNPYFFLSKIHDADIKKEFAHWQFILVGFAVLLTLLISSVIVLLHRFTIERRARFFNMELVNQLFKDDRGLLIATEDGRVIASNSTAASLLSTVKEELTDRNVMRIFQWEHQQYLQVIKSYQENGQHQQELDLRHADLGVLTVTFSSLPLIQSANAVKDEYLLISICDITESRKLQEQAALYYQISETAIPVVLVDIQGRIQKSNSQFDQAFKLKSSSDSLTYLLGGEIEKQWGHIQQQLALKGLWRGNTQYFYNGQQVCFDVVIDHADADSHELDLFVCSFIPSISSFVVEKEKKIPHRSRILTGYEEVESYFSSLDENKRLYASMMLLDITPVGVFSHMSDIEKLEKRQHDIEVRLLLELPKAYQLALYQLGKLMVMLPNTSSDEAHQFAVEIYNRLDEIGLSEGISIGIVSYHQGQSLKTFMDNAEIALQRAKQNAEQNICQAFTRFDVPGEES
ncbi:PAS domain-containing protein [Parashewanella tropica]|uniref:PAS domain-containing protein n=1 Tax=Parashewanella tropica TaxID=2547970 RepID=UPI00105983A5|nr:PAS domain-containing protein [Parashewanella tropica]